MKNTFTLLLLLLLFLSCAQKATGWQSAPGLRKLSDEERLERARKHHFDSGPIVYRDSLGKVISPEFAKSLNSKDFFSDLYVNQDGVVTEMLVRRMTDQDRRLIVAIQDAFQQSDRPKTDPVFDAEITLYRKKYKEDFISTPNSPLGVGDTALLKFFAPAPQWRFTAQFTRTPDMPVFDLSSYSGSTAQYRQYGILTFEYASQIQQLPVYQNMLLLNIAAYKDYLFLPFKDRTNGTSTYGGGRYIDLRTGDITPEGTVLLDFNKCYNPYCAYSEGYSCPVPPKANHLLLKIEAGEKLFKHH